MPEEKKKHASTCPRLPGDFNYFINNCFNKYSRPYMESIRYIASSLFQIMNKGFIYEGTTTLVFNIYISVMGSKFLFKSKHSLHGMLTLTDSYRCCYRTCIWRKCFKFDLRLYVHVCVSKCSWKFIK